MTFVVKLFQHLTEFDAKSKVAGLYVAEKHNRKFDVRLMNALCRSLSFGFSLSGSG